MQQARRRRRRPQPAETFHLARARLAAEVPAGHLAPATHLALGSLRLPPQPQQGRRTTPAPPAVDRLASLLKPPAWGVDTFGERDGDKEKMAGGVPALSQGLVAELAGYQPARPAQVARHAVVAGPTHARREARASSRATDVAAAWPPHTCVCARGGKRRTFCELTPACLSGAPFFVYHGTCRNAVALIVHKTPRSEHSAWTHSSMSLGISRRPTRSPSV